MASSLSSKVDPYMPERDADSVRGGSGTVTTTTNKGSVNPKKIGEPDDVDLLALTVKAESISRDFYLRQLSKPLSQSYRAWNNEHATWSKYLGAGFKGRSRLFTPKTRLAVRKNKATARAAMFSTDDIATVGAVREDDLKQLATAAVKKELLNSRLGRDFGPRSMSWFKIAMGGVHEAQLAGMVVSKQHWEFQTKQTGTEEVAQLEFNPNTGAYEEIVTKEPILKVVLDRPMVSLVALENCSLDPAAPWYDPVGLGTWFRARFPMRVGDAKAMIEDASKDGIERGWLKVDEINWSLGRISTGDAKDAARRAREQGEDRFLQASSIGDLDLIWMVENFMRIGDRDLHYWTLGTECFASRIRDVEEAYPEYGGERPYKAGVAEIEPHRVAPMSPVESWQQLQQELNDTTNLRLDTVKRGIAPLVSTIRGAGVDMATLQRRGQPETVLQVNKHEDVFFHPSQPPPGQAYTEVAQGNALFDELAGVYSTSSVQSDRKLHETVGGMQLASGSANSVSEFDLAVVIETWAEPVLRQVMKSIEYFESDEAALMVAGEKARVWERYKYVPTWEDLEKTETTLRINIGIGSADPMQRLAKFTQANAIVAPMMPILKEQGITINGEAMIEEVYGHAGFKDGRRFFNFADPAEQAQGEGPPPEVLKIMEELKYKREELAAKGEMHDKELETKVVINREDNQTELDKENIKGQRDMAKHVTDMHMGMAKHAAGLEATARMKREQGREQRLQKLTDVFAGQGGGAPQRPQDGPMMPGLPMMLPQEPQAQPEHDPVLLKILEGQAHDRQMLMAMLTHMARAIAQANGPKKLIFDEDGNPIGVAPLGAEPPQQPPMIPPPTPDFGF
ncbi:MAG: portal protein [Methyloceanibacter sp.]